MLMSDEFVNTEVWTTGGFVNSMVLECSPGESEGGYMELLVTLPRGTRKVRLRLELLQDSRIIKQLTEGVRTSLRFAFNKTGDFPWMALTGIVLYGRLTSIQEM
jgi:hypothetical protein